MRLPAGVGCLVQVHTQLGADEADITVECPALVHDRMDVDAPCLPLQLRAAVKEFLYAHLAGLIVVEQVEDLVRIDFVKAQHCEVGGECLVLQHDLDLI